MDSSRFNNSVEILAAIYAEVACIEGMKAENMQRAAVGASMAYTETSFADRANTLTYLADRARANQ